MSGFFFLLFLRLLEWPKELQTFRATSFYLKSVTKEKRILFKRCLFFFFHSLLRQRSIKVDKIFRPNICIIWIMRLLFVAPACIRMSRGTKLQIFGYNIGNWIFSKHF